MGIYVANLKMIYPSLLSMEKLMNLKRSLLDTPGKINNLYVIKMK
jgi:hypothetical protein